MSLVESQQLTSPPVDHKRNPPSPHSSLLTGYQAAQYPAFLERSWYYVLASSHPLPGSLPSPFCRVCSLPSLAWLVSSQISSVPSMCQGLPQASRIKGNCLSIEFPVNKGETTAEARSVCKRGRGLWPHICKLSCASSKMQDHSKPGSA